MERYVIHVTKLCNMNCTYCYEQDKTSTYTWDETKRLIDNIIEYNKDKMFNIEFLGGEPLLAFNLLKKSVDYMELAAGDRINTYGITTNGTILNDEIITFLINNKKVYWNASMDGTKFMNQLRTIKLSEENSHDIVLKNHEILRNKIGWGRIGVHMVTHPYNIYLLSKGIDHLYKNGVRSIGVGTVESTIIIGREYAKCFIEQLDIVSENIINNKYPGLHIDVLESLKPRTDTRYYIRDNTGKVIAESYGRTNDDITKQNIYNSQSTSSKLGTLIEDIREIVYLNHQERINRK